MDLKEWCVHHIKQKDIIKRNLISYKHEKNKVLCEFKESNAIYYYEKNLDLNFIKDFDDKKMIFFVCNCNEYNFKLLVDNWNLFKKNSNLTFIFVNESFSDKWIIKPFIHAKIAESSTLKQGLRSMYDLCIGISN